MHTDWVNDIVVCNQGANVVSASADRTVKIWNPYSEDDQQAHTIGWHADYVKCLAYASQAGWVASGGLDKRICIWDLEKREAVLSLQVGSMNMNNDASAGDAVGASHGPPSKSSIYAMAVNPTGSLLVTGSPEKVVRVWDPKSGKRISKLTGHTDNIRALLISHDGQYVISGSSDSTIKLWSVKAQRCITTYETHTDSVWSLYSEDPDLKTFYAGSRDGLVTKTEIPRESASGVHEESECIGLFKEQSGVGKIVVYDDTHIWTATSSSSIHRWLSVPSRANRQVLTRSEYNIDIPSTAMVNLPPAQAIYSPQVQEHFITNDSLTLYAGSVMSIPMSYKDDGDESIESLIPLREEPDQTILGTPGITSHLVLQNRLHVLTKDTTGDVALWDIVRAISIQLQESNCFDCEMYADEMDDIGDYEYREDQRVNLGKWLLTNLFAPFIEAQVQGQQEQDGIVDDEQNQIGTTESTTPSIHHHDSSAPSMTPANTVPGTPSSTIPSSSTNAILPPNMTPIQPPDTALTSPRPRASGGGLSIALNHASLHQESLQSPKQQPLGPSSSSGIPAAKTASHPSTVDYFSTTPSAPLQQQPATALPTSPTSPTQSNFMNRLRNLSVKSKPKPPFNPPTSPTTATDPADDREDTSDDEHSNHRPSVVTNSRHPSTTSVNDHRYHRYTPPHLRDFPPLQMPSDTSVLIAEESAEASGTIDLYRGNVASIGDEHALILKAAPNWLLSFLLFNKVPSKDVAKLTFILKPHEDSDLPELPGG
ncbi:WD40 repeat-like protein [Hesseltinella vesiculosa]|uniref:WD40 repeat-like protein n=1 Tax=Hesseltinella vesiculosa TaxID=101127 RepID=A0A1X2GQL8_9FUNG|nr:WD40 repeat-like protein [Hesseltinella vesiculosa]